MPTSRGIVYNQLIHRAPQICVQHELNNQSTSALVYPGIFFFSYREKGTWTTSNLYLVPGAAKSPCTAGTYTATLESLHHEYHLANNLIYISAALTM